MKKIIFMLITVNLLMLIGVTCIADGLVSDAFEIVYIENEIENYDWKSSVKARYKDTKEIIPFSEIYDGRMYATVPKENVKREIEEFVSEQIEFTDYSDEYYEFFVFRELSKCGVIKGDENGCALPFSEITRAEATAMLMRLFGLAADDDYVLDFVDVSTDDWYYGVVAAANKHGIVMGDSPEKFSPERNITREEMTVMTARAVEYAGIGYPGDVNLNAVDRDLISEWALSAYSLMGNYVSTDVDSTNPENPVRVICPQKYATRFDVAELLYNVCEYCPVYPSLVAEEYGFDKQMPVIDGSTSTYPFTQVIYSNLFHNGTNHLSRPEKHSKSHESYKKLINGEIDMMFASVYPASDILNYAKENGVEIELIPIAYDAMIFFTNIENSASNLTTEQITDIYVNNAYDNWNEIGGPDALLYPYCRNNDSGSHAQMEKHFLNGNEIHEKIRNESTSTEMSSILLDVIYEKTYEPLGYGLGYSIYYYYHNADAVLDTKKDLKLLSIDGVYPTDETIANGTYPLSNNTYIALRKDTPEDAPAEKMAEFMLTDLGQLCVQSAGFGRLK